MRLGPGGMPIDLHGCRYGGEPLVPLIPDLDDDVTEIALRQPAGSNLGRRAGRSLRPGFLAGELRTFVIPYEVGPFPDVKMLERRGNPLLEMVPLLEMMLWNGGTAKPERRFRSDLSCPVWGRRSGTGSPRWPGRTGAAWRRRPFRSIDAGVPADRSATVVTLLASELFCPEAPNRLRSPLERNRF